jgi:hypothetical protein
VAGLETGQAGEGTRPEPLPVTPTTGVGPRPCCGFRRSQDLTRLVLEADPRAPAGRQPFTAGHRCRRRPTLGRTVLVRPIVASRMKSRDPVPCNVDSKDYPLATPHQAPDHKNVGTLVRRRDDLFWDLHAWLTAAESKITHRRQTGEAVRGAGTSCSDRSL